MGIRISFRSRPGMGSMGCLFSLLIIATLVYFGAHVGGAYWRYFEFRDDMAQAIRFAGNKTNDQIQRELQSQADSLDLPEAAGNVTIRRAPHRMVIESEYYEHLDVPSVGRDVHFHPRASGSY